MKRVSIVPIVSIVSMVMAVSLTFVSCNIQEEDPAQADAKNVPIPTKMMIDVSDMQVGSTTSAKLISKGIIAAQTSTSKCDTLDDTNSLLNFGFYMACATGEFTKELIIGKNAAENMDCNDSIEDGILGSVACNIPAGTQSLSAFKSDDGNYLALDFADFNNVGSSGSWTGDENTFPLAFRMWAGSTDSSLEPAVGLFMTTKQKGTVTANMGLFDATTTGKVISEFDMSVDAANCSIDNADKTNCKWHEFKYTSDCTATKDDIKSMYVKAFAKDVDNYDFGVVQYNIEFCSDKTDGITFDQIKGNSIKSGTEVYTDFTFYNAGSRIQDYSGSQYDIVDTVLTQWLEDMSSGITEGADGICYNQSSFSMDDGTNFWSEYYNSGNPTLSGVTNASAGLCSSMSAWASTYLSDPTGVSTLLDSFGSAP